MEKNPHLKDGVHSDVVLYLKVCCYIFISIYSSYLHLSPPSFFRCEAVVTVTSLQDPSDKQPMFTLALHENFSCKIMSVWKVLLLVEARANILMKVRVSKKAGNVLKS